MDFEGPLLEISRKDDEEIIVPGLADIVAPLPFAEPEPEPFVHPSTPLTTSHREPFRQVNGARKRKSDVSMSVAGANLRKRRRRVENIPASSLPHSNQTEVLSQHFNGEIKKAEYFQYFGNPKYLTLEQGQLCTDLLTSESSSRRRTKPPPSPKDSSVL